MHTKCEYRMQSVCTNKKTVTLSKCEEIPKTHAKSSSAQPPEISDRKAEKVLLEKQIVTSRRCIKAFPPPGSPPHPSWNKIKKKKFSKKFQNLKSKTEPKIHPQKRPLFTPQNLKSFLISIKENALAKVKNRSWPATSPPDLHIPCPPVRARSCLSAGIFQTTFH